MPTLSRKPHRDPHRPGWHVYFGDVRVGHIGKRAGVPQHVHQWAWSIGFYPGMEPGTKRSGTADSFERAREMFETEWRLLEPVLTEAQFEEWRRARDFHAWKDRMHDEHRLLPTQVTSGRSQCFCGAEITNDSMTDHVRNSHRGIGT